MYGFHGENKLRRNKVLFKSIKCDYNILLVFENIIEHFYAIPVFFFACLYLFTRFTYPLSARR